MKQLLIKILVVAILLVGCGSSNTGGDNLGNETGGNEVSINVKMTERETELLCESFPFDEERIKNGDLSDAQNSALKELRMGMDLIDSKYADLSYDVSSFAPATKMTGQAILNIKIEGDSKEYKAYVIYDKDGKPKSLETVYGNVVGERYDKYICDCLESNSINAKAYTSFETPVNDEISNDTSPEEIVKMGSDIVRYTDIFIEDNGDRQVVVDRIKSIMESTGIYAVFEVDFVESLSDYTIPELEKGRKNFESVTFECVEG